MVDNTQLEADAEAIASVVADLKDGRARPLKDRRIHDIALKLVRDPTVVDCTAIYHSLIERDEIALYEDHPCISPPWDEAAICYRNEHGNVIVMHTTAFSPKTDRWDNTANPVDWDQVRWGLNTFVWVGGRGADRTAFPTSGPMHMWRTAIYDSGEPADLHWVQLVEDYPMDNWDMAQLVLLGALNFMNCRNVDLVEPQRRRPARRRMERTGVKVQTINVMPFGRSSRSGRQDPVGGTPLTSVRGHFALYGPEHGRGLLFGKLAGRFWIPQHARGDTSQGENVSNYVLKP
jgi:hypothetical protein